MPRHAKLVYGGFWLYLMLQTAFDRVQQDVTGTVRLQRYKGNYTITRWKSDQSLSQPHLATFEEGSGYNQQNGVGFRLNALHCSHSNDRAKKPNGKSTMFSLTHGS